MMDTQLFLESWQGDEEEHFVAWSGRIVLECRCGERIVLLGLEADWHKEARDAFECECGEKLTIADNRVDEKASSIEQLLLRIRRGTPSP